MTDFNEIANALRYGRAPIVSELVKKAIDEGVEAEDILNKGLIVGMGEIGQLFKNNKVYVPEVMIAARAMYAGLDILKPILAEKDIEPVGTVAIGTVKGDMHDIGKNLVAMMMEGAGFKVIDLGTNVAPEKFIDAVVNQGAQTVAMSALLTTTMQQMKVTIDAFESAGLRDKVKIMIGGAPVTQQYADDIGADGYSDDAASATDLAMSFVG